jgi:hypothetical protein
MVFHVNGSAVDSPKYLVIGRIAFAFPDGQINPAFFIGKERPVTTAVMNHSVHIFSQQFFFAAVSQ